MAKANQREVTPPPLAGNWKVVAVWAYHPEQNPTLNDYLAQGWEPFAVTLNGTIPIYHLRIQE